MNGDEVRNVRFPQRLGGYRAADVDDLLDRVATELDAGRPAGPLIANAALQDRVFARGCYDHGAVNWFLGQLKRAGDPSEAESDPWRDLAADPYCIRRQPRDPAGRVTAPSAKEYAHEWRAFGQQPGTRLSWVRTGVIRRELRTADQQAVASFRTTVAGRISATTLSAGGKRFTLQRVTEPAWTGTAETMSRDWLGQGQMVLNEAGIPVLYSGGRYMEFPGQRWLRFPVRGTKRANAIMTAVDQGGNKVARYRLAPARHQWWTDVTNTAEIMVHPSQRLTEELSLALALSAPWLVSSFQSGGGG